MKQTFLLLLLCLGMTSCRTIDETSTKNDICEVHKEKMRIEELRISPAYEGYISDYYDLMMNRFPNHGKYRFNHTESVLGARMIRTYVCDTCDQEFEKYWDENKKK